MPVNTAGVVRLQVVCIALSVTKLWRYVELPLLNGLPSMAHSRLPVHVVAGALFTSSQGMYAAYVDTTADGVQSAAGAQKLMAGFVTVVYFECT
eukprot:COSAG01_NODE_15873_length_1290_cov_1.213266_1_plen_94_part_00